MSNVPVGPPGPSVYPSAGYETAERVSNVLHVVSYLVVIVGVIHAVLVVIAGSKVAEPWFIGGYKVEEDSTSILLSVAVALSILVFTAAGWALLQGARLVVRYVGARPMIAE